MCINLVNICLKYVLLQCDELPYIFRFKIKFFTISAKVLMRETKMRPITHHENLYGSFSENM